MKHSSQKSHFQTKQISIGPCSKFTWPMRNQLSRLCGFYVQKLKQNRKCNRTLNQSMKRIMGRNAQLSGLDCCDLQRNALVDAPQLIIYRSSRDAIHLNVNKWLWVVNLEVRGHLISLLLLSLAERNVGGRSVQCKSSSTFSHSLTHTHTHTHTHMLAADWSQSCCLDFCDTFKQGCNAACAKRL